MSALTTKRTYPAAHKADLIDSEKSKDSLISRDSQALSRRRHLPELSRSHSRLLEKEKADSTAQRLEILLEVEVDLAL